MKNIFYYIIVFIIISCNIINESNEIKKDNSMNLEDSIAIYYSNQMIQKGVYVNQEIGYNLNLILIENINLGINDDYFEQYGVFQYVLNSVWGEDVIIYVDINNIDKSIIINELFTIEISENIWNSNGFEVYFDDREGNRQFLEGGLTFDLSNGFNNPYIFLNGINNHTGVQIIYNHQIE